ncbi:putative bifunctional diguanylate cyclase/phosphodiesterase [Bounagaea algeriensis]
MIQRHRPPHSDAQARPPVRSDADPVRRQRFRLFSAALFGSALVVVVLVAWWLPFHYDGDLFLVAPALFFGFLLAERFTIDLDVRRVGWTISFTEIPLLVGMLLAPFEVVLLANVGAGLVANLGRRAASHVVYNSGVLLLETALPFAAAHAVGRALLGLAPPWFGPVVGTLMSSLISCGCALAAVYVLGGPMRISEGVRLAVRTLAVGLFNTAVGLVGYEVSRSTPWGWLLVTLVAVGVAVLYWAYSGLLREQRDLETLSDVSLRVARSGQAARFSGDARGAGNWVAGNWAAGDWSAADWAAEWDPTAERIREQLNAKRVVLRLLTDPNRLAGGADTDAEQRRQRPHPSPGRPAHGPAQPRSTEYCTAVAGEELPPEAEELPAGDPLSLLPGEHVRSYRVSDAPEEVRGALARRGAHETLAAPLRGANQLLGTVEVHDRLSRWRGFGRADVRLLHTLTSHLATALDNRRLLARLRHDAYHDPLTGSLNRTGFREVATGHITDGAAGAVPAREGGLGDGSPGERAGRGRAAVVLRVDLDVHTTVSEALGYMWGDRLVSAVGERLREQLGAVPLARLEAASFAVLLLDHTEQHAHAVAERLHGVLSEPYPLDRIVIEATAVAGYVSSHPAEGEPETDVDTLLQRADMALRAARSGEDGVRGYAPAMGQVFLRRFQLVTQFRHALDSGQVEVHYQPKVSLPQSRLIGAEALVRWSHPEYGRLSPDEFVPVVEATGLVDALTAFVLECGLRKVREWLDRGMRMSVAVNLSVRNLADAEFPDRVAEALNRYAVPPELVVFELTESSVMADPERALPVLRRLHALGVVLAVDDFGTGYSSLAYLRRLPVDEVKIDKSFVLGMGTDLSDMAVVRSIVELGHSLQLAVVAEGVEDDAARGQLVGMGCDVAQGYLISRPMSEQRFEAWLDARTARTAVSGGETILTLLPRA